MNEGKLRFLMGSTDKMGTGVNAQKLLVAQHHIDPPHYMRPDEVEQRDGRILRHGNTNPEVRIYRYVTEPSPDAFAWGGIERKAGFITQITHGDLTTRQMDDIGEVVLGYAEMKAAATGDPAIIELVGVEAELNKMESLERSHSDKLTGIQWRLAQMPQEIASLEGTVGRLGQAEGAIKLPPDGDFTMTVAGKKFKAVLEAGQALQDIIEKEKAQHRDGNFSLPGVGNLYGLPVSIQASGGKVYAMMQAGPVELPVELADNAQGNVMRLRNRLGNVAKEKAKAQGDLDELRDRMPKLR